MVFSYAAVEDAYACSNAAPVGSGGIDAGVAGGGLTPAHGDGKCGAYRIPF